MFSTVLAYLLARSVAGMGRNSANYSKYIGSTEVAPTQSYTLFIVANARNMRLIVPFQAWQTERTMSSSTKLGSGGTLRFRILWSSNSSSSFTCIFDASAFHFSTILQRTNHIHLSEWISQLNFLWAYGPVNLHLVLFLWRWLQVEK